MAEPLKADGTSTVEVGSALYPLEAAAVATPEGGLGFDPADADPSETGETGENSAEGNAEGNEEGNPDVAEPAEPFLLPIATDSQGPV